MHLESACLSFREVELVNCRTSVYWQPSARFDYRGGHLAVGAGVKTHRDESDSQMNGATFAFIDGEGCSFGEPVSSAVFALRHLKPHKPSSANY